MVEANNTGLDETRTRVTCHLPLNNQREHAAVDAIFTYLEGLRKKRLGIKGYTHTSCRPTAYNGVWWSTTRRKWIRDNIVLCTVDYKISFQSVDVARVVNELKQRVKDAYSRYGSPQEEIWVVAQQVFRQV